MKLRILSISRLSFPLASAIAAMVATPSARAVDMWWDGGTNNWTTTSAWTTNAGATTPDPGSAPGSSDDLTFNRTGNNAAGNTVSLAGGGRAARSLTFNTTGTSLFRANASGTTTARTLSIGAGGITINAGAGAITIGDSPATYGAINVPLAASQTWTNNSSNGFTLAGVVSGGFSLTKSGSAQIRLNGANTYTGATIVDGGDLLIGNYSGLNSTSGITVSGGSASLQLVQVGSGSTSNTINKPVSLHGTLRTVGGSGTNLLNLTWGGNITLAGASTIWNNGNSTIDIDGQVDLGSNSLTYQADRAGSRIDGNIIGVGGSFIKTSPQNLTLTGSNTFTGNITVNGGTLIGAGATNSPGVTVFGARDNTRTITVTAGGTLQFNSGNILGANHVATTAPTLIINGGTVTNGGSATNNALNQIEINAGTLTATTGSASGYGAWNLNGNVTSTGASTISTADSVNGTVMLKVAGTTDFNVASGTLNVSAPLIDNMNDANTGSLNKSGAGTMVLSSASNSYTGSTTVAGGTLALSGSAAISTSSGVTINGSDAKLLHTSTTALSPVVTLTQGTLTGSGTVHAVDVGNATGGIVSNNNGVAGAALTVGTLTFTGAATINTFSNGVSAPIATTSLASNAAGVVTVNPSAAIWSAGTYDLISYGGGSIGGAGFSQFALGTVAGASPRQSKALGNSGTAITLTVGADAPPYWVGDGNGKWNLTSTNNWKLTSDNSYTTFLANDNAIFNDSATGSGPLTVDIDSANVETTSVSFGNHLKDYVLSGAFGISAGTLSKSGGGTVTITNANSYTGNTVISGGVLDVSTDGAQLYSGASGISAVVTVSNGGVLVVRNYGQGSPTGLGSTSLGNLNNGGGQVVLDGGTLRFNNETGTRGRKTNIGTGGGTLEVVNNSALILNSSGSFIFSGANTLTLAGDSTSSGTIESVIAGTDVSLVKTGDATWSLSGTNTYTGNTTISAGILAMSGNKITSSPTIFIGDGATLRSTGTFILSANQNITGTGATGNLLHATPGASNFQTTAGSAISTSGILTISRLDVRGAGNVISGGTVQSGGAASGQRGLLVGNTVTGDLTLNSGASLTTGASGTNAQDILGNGTATGTFIINGGTYTNTSGLATLQLGNAGGNGGGTLTLNSGSASIGTLVYQVGASQSGIIDLNGGTLTLGAITSNGVGTREFNFGGGQLVAGGGLTFPADVTANVMNGGAKIDTNGFSATIASPMVNFGGTSTGGLTKSGLGTLTLSGANTYVGGTVVNAGTLRFSSAGSSTTDVTVSGGAQAGALVAANDAQWINTGDLTLQNNAAAIVDYGSTAPSTGFAPISVNDFTFGTSPGVRLAGASVPSLQVGTTYPLVTWSGSGPVDGSAFSLLTHRVTGNFTVASNTLSVTITSNAAGAPISWKTGNGVWDTTTSNWLAGNLTPTTFFDTLDSVLFGDATGASGNPVVTLSTAIAPLGMTMETTGRNYTVAGTGSIGGSGGLSLPVTNTGTLTLSTGNNTFSGGTSILGGTLALGHPTDTLPDSGAVALDGASATLSLGSNSDVVGAVSLKNGASITGTGTLTGTSYAVESGSISATLGGTSGLTKTTTGAVTLSAANTFTGSTTLSGGTLVLANTAALQNTTGSMAVGIGTTLHLATDTAFTTFPSIGASSGASPVTFISDRATSGAGLVHSLGTPNLGNNTFNFTQGPNVTSGTAGFTLEGIGMTAGAAGTTILNPTDATVSITGPISISANPSAKTLELSGTIAGNSISGDISNGTGTGAVVSLGKSGAGTWTLSGVNAYTGATIIDQGTLAFATNNQTLAGGLTFGSTAGSTNNGALDLTSASATFGGGLVVQTNSSSGNSITIGAGRTLTFTGSSLTNAITVGNNANAALANLQVTGGGTLLVDESARNIVVASTDVAGASAQMDLSGLGTFNATVANLYVGRPTSAAGAAAGGRPADSMNLAGTNIITVSGDLVVGAQASVGFQGSNFLRLGTSNTINAGAIVVGNGRINGNFAFNAGLTNPSATLRGATGGTSRVNITLGDQINASGVGTGGGGSNVTSGTMNFTDGTVDALIDTLLMGVGGTSASNNRGRGAGTFTFGAGSSVDINTLVIGRAASTTAASSNQSPALAGTGTFNMNGGTLAINAAITIANDNDASNTTNGIQNVAGTFNQTDGIATIGSISTPVNVLMGSHLNAGNSGLATATMNLTGGTTNIFGNIQEGNPGAGTITSNLTLNGGTLDMNANSIGISGSSIDNLNFESGTLKNVAAINGTGGLTKTTAGTLLLDGTIGYTGATTVSAGTLALAASTSIASSSTVNIDATGTLDTSAQATHTIPALQPLTISIDPTDTGSSGRISAAGLNINTAVVTLSPTATLDDPVYVLATYTSLSGSAFSSVTGVPSGYNLVYNHEGNKIALVQSAANDYAAWASLNGVTGGPNGDSDFDGVKNLVEYALADGQERGSLTGNTLSFTKRGAPWGSDLTYVIETSDNLGISDPWSPVLPDVNNGTTISYTLQIPGDNFGRLKVTQTSP